MSAVLKPAAAPTPADFARGYAQRYGFHIVPLPPRAKRPLKTDWGNDATSDPAALSEYFTEHPDWNMGVALGPSRMCSFDVDDIEATRMIFEEFGWSLDALRAEFPTIQGSSKGLRVMFRVPEGVTLKYQKLTWPSRDDPKKRFTVWELRAADHEQRQDVLPPSIHPDTGEPYQWLTKPNGHFPNPPNFLLALWNNWDALKPQLQAVCPWAPPVQLPVRSQRPQQPGSASVIDAYNAAHHIESTLTQYGYARHGRRYLSPHSGTGLPGVNVFPEDNRCWIHHASDPLCSNEKNQPVSPFDLFRYNEHGDDYSKAVKAAAEQLGMKYTRPSAPPAKETVDPDTGEITGYTGAPYISPEAAAKRAPDPDAPKFTHTPMDVFSETPAPELDPSWLPKTIADYAFDQAQLVGVSPAMIAIPSIVACAAAIHDGIEIKVKRFEKWTEQPRLWCAVVGPPSVRKSPSLKRAISRLRKINIRLCEQNEKEDQIHQAKKEDYLEAKKLSKKTGDPLPPVPQEPAKQRLVVEDTTIEALSEVLKHNPRGVLCIQDELTGWFGSMDAYSGGKAANKDRAHWLEIYNGGHRMVDRVTRGSIIIPNWSACMVGGIQPDMMRKIAAQMGEDGLMQRFMVIIGQNTGVYVDRPDDGISNTAYDELIEKLFALQPANNPVIQSEAAHIVRERITKLSMQLSAYEGLPGGLRSHFGKWEGLYARLVLTYHVIECAEKSVYPTSVDVSEETAIRVEKLMQYFLMHHARAFYNDVMTAQGYLEHVRWIAGHILAQQKSTITVRDIMQAYRAWRNIDDFNRHRIMMVLEDSGWLVPTDELSKTYRKPVAWHVNPEVHVLYSPRAEIERGLRKDMHEHWKSLAKQGQQESTNSDNN